MIDHPAETERPLSLADARSLVDAALAEARRSALRVAVAVTDEGGHPILLARDDGAGAFAAAAATAKARTAATSGLSTARWAELVAATPGLATLPDVVAAAGGQPLPRALGGIGVAGGQPDQDDAVAIAAIAALAAG